MLKYLNRFLKNLEEFEKSQPSRFWLCSIVIYISFSTVFDTLFPKPLSQSHVVIEQVRGGGKEKKFDLDFHRQLEQHFPDWTERMDYQKKQEKLFKLAIRKKREMKRLKIKDDSKFYTKEELDAMDYFQGNGIYAKYQDTREKNNIFDTRQSFLLKMHDDKLRNNFLNNLNRKKN